MTGHSLRPVIDHSAAFTYRARLPIGNAVFPGDGDAAGQEAIAPWWEGDRWHFGGGQLALTIDLVTPLEPWLHRGEVVVGAVEAEGEVREADAVELFGKFDAIAG